jgi:poly(3-hydroxybutyrate) depolymerase
VRNEQGELERVRPQDITTTALMSVEGELDDISGSGQTRAVHDLCTSVLGEQKHLEVPGAGHYGIFSGRRWRDVVYPAVTEFILKHQNKVGEVAKPVAKKAAVKTTQAVTPVATARKRRA